MSFLSRAFEARFPQRSCSDPSSGEGMPLRKSRSGKTSASPDDAAEAFPAAGLDRWDVAILRELQADARLSNAELAARIGLSAAPTWRRLRRLEEQGVVTGYRAEIDRRRIG